MLKKKVIVIYTRVNVRINFANTKALGELHKDWKFDLSMSKPKVCVIYAKLNVYVIYAKLNICLFTS